MKLPDDNVMLNGAALFLAAFLGGAMLYQAVPPNNEQLVGVIVGGIIGFLAGGPANPKPPANPKEQP